MKIQAIKGNFSVCQLKDGALIDISRPFTFTARTDEELSLVCPSESVPSGVLQREDGWRMLRIAGTLDFSLIGILSRIAGALAEESIPIFALSTYNTDYILVKDAYFDRACSALSRRGYHLSL